MQRSVWLTVVGACAGALLPIAALGVVLEGFESLEPTWRLAEADCSAKVLLQQRVFERAHGGRGAEHIELRAGQGTYVHLTHSIPHAKIIRELQPSLWVRSDRPGVQILARVVFPRSTDRRTGRPVTALVAGDSYNRVGSWQQLFVRDIERLTQRQVQLLRQRGHDVQAAEAYIDLVVLNGYGGPGVTRLWIDDLALDGYARTSDTPPAATVALGAPTTDTADGLSTGIASASTRPRLRGDVLLVNGRPFFARVIEHNGEPLSWLQSLGFNTVTLRTRPTLELAREARQLGIWLVAPPPINLVLADQLGDRALAWKMDRDGAITKQLRDQGTPLVWEANNRLAPASSLDLAIRGSAVLGTHQELSRYGDRLRAEARQRGGTLPFWASVDTEFDATLAEQMALLAGGRMTNAPDPDQLRLLAIEAASSGARGLYFRSHTRLDGQDEATRLRAATLRLVNVELSLFEPWLAGGTDGGALENDDPTTRIRAFETARSRVVVVSRGSVDEQFAPVPIVRGPVSFAARSASISDQVYCLTPQGLRPLTQQPTGDVSISDQGRLSFVLATQDELAINRVGRLLADSRSEALALRRTIADLYLRETERVVNIAAQQRQGSSTDAATLRQARALIDQGGRQIDAKNDRYGLRVIEEGVTLIRQLRHQYWSHAQRAFPSPTSSPLAVSFATLPGHWKLGSRLQGTSWSENVLPGGDFEDLQHTINTGWTYAGSADPSIETNVELSPHTTARGRMALHVSARSTAPSLPSFAPSVTVTSGPVPAHTRQVFRVHGWAKFAPMADTDSALLVYDSATGRALADRIDATASWREFTLYRAIPRGEDLRVILAIVGTGDAWIDGVTVSLLE